MLEWLLSAANTYLFGPGLTAAVFLCGLYLLFRLKPFFITHPKQVLAALKRDAPADGIHPIKAMMLALAGTLGVGNIAGVTSAIAVGGSGAVFWMWVSTLSAFPIKYAEILLAVRHRRRDDDRRWHGGAYYYIADLGGMSRSYRRFASAASVLFAVLCTITALTMGGAVQANAVAASMGTLTDIPAPVIGLLLAILTLLVISGGLNRIADFTMKLVPLMSLLYIGMALWVILTNAGLLGTVFEDIIADALGPDAFSGGITGFLTSRAVRLGVTRGIVSNEAGCGTAPIAHAAAEVKSPAAQGIWGIFEVFADTIIICTLSALTVLVAGHHGIAPDARGLSSAMAAFTHFIPFAGPLITLAVCFFAFGTIICWYYYSTESLGYLMRNRSDRARRYFLRIWPLLYVGCAALGASVREGLVWSLADFTTAAMTAVNITALLLYAREIREETDRSFGG